MTESLDPTTIPIKLDSTPSALVSSKSQVQNSYTVKQLYDLLNGFIRDPFLRDCENVDSKDDETTILDCIDKCLDTIDKAWKDEISRKKASDIENLLMDKAPIAVNVLVQYYGKDGSKVIYDELLEMVIKLKRMKAVTQRQKMIYIPVKFLPLFIISCHDYMLVILDIM